MHESRLKPYKFLKNLFRNSIGALLAHPLSGCILTILFLSLPPSLLCADDSDSKDSQTILSLHAKGTALYDEQKYAEAAQVYREMLTVKHDYQYYYYVGECDYMRKRYDLAVEAFSIFLQNADDTVASEAIEHAKNVIAEVAGAVGYLSVQDENESEVWVDGEHRETTSLQGAIAVMSGTLAVSFKENGETVYEAEIEVAQGETVELQRPEPVAEQPAAVPEPQEEPLMQDEPSEVMPAASEESQRSPLKTVGIVTAGIGVATVVAGLVTGKLVASKKDQLTDNCDNQKFCEDGNRELHDDAKSLAKATDILLVTGVALTVTGVILAIAGHKKSKTAEKIALKTTPLFDSTMLGVSIHGSF